MKNIALHWQILISICLAIIAGIVTGTESGVGLFTFIQLYDFLGTLFLNALKMIIVPLIVSSIIVGVASLGGGENLGRIGGRTLRFYLISSFLAIMLGLFFVNIISPGIIDGQPAGEQLALLNPDTNMDFIEKVEGKGLGDLVQVVVRMIPVNIVDAAAQGQMLGLITFSLLFGFFLTKINTTYQTTLLNFWSGIAEVMMEMTLWVMKFAPIGVFGLVAETVAQTGFSAFIPLLKFFTTVVLALAAHVFIVLPILLKTKANISPIRHYKTMFPVLLTAFSTASSAATLPLTMDTVQKQAGVSEKTSSFVLPLGATVNMDGTALYECVAALFLAQAYGLELSFVTQFTVVFLALVTSIGVAGIPAASLVAISVILGAIGLPLEAIGILLVTDRVLDMLRTAVNVYSDSCCAVVVAKQEGETIY